MGDLYPPNDAAWAALELLLSAAALVATLFSRTA
jgi:hypothetical protein